MKRSYFNARQTSDYNNDESFEMNDSNEMNSELFDEEKDENKRKNRNLSEKKRRDHFNQLINELCSVISYGQNAMDSQMSDSSGCKPRTDKSSILRSSIDFLKSHSQVVNKTTKRESTERMSATNGPDVAQTTSIFSWKPSFLLNEEFIHFMLEALDSFIILIEANSEGKIVYISETIIPLLGMRSTNLIRKLNDSDEMLTIYDLIHEEEMSFVENFLNAKQTNNGYENYASILLHFKDNDFDDSDSNSYQLVRLIGSFHEMNETLGSEPSGNRCFVGIGRLQAANFMRELNYQMSNNENEFVSRNSLEWKFLHLDHRATRIIGYLPFEILGTSGYDYYHWNDLDEIVAGHEQLMRTGEGTSCVHRFLTKSQHWIWLRTNYYIAYHHWNSKPEFIVCTHTVVKEQDVLNAKIDRVNDRIDGQNQLNMDLSGTDDDGMVGDKHQCSTTSSINWSKSCDSTPTTTDSPFAPSSKPKTGAEPTKKRSSLQEFLKQKHHLLEHQIRQQQEELRRVTEQLVLVQAVNKE